MAVSIQIIGITNVLENLEKANRLQGERLERGLVKCGFYLQRKSQQVVPVDTGALKNSAYTFKEGHGLRTVVYVGYTQAYAIFVHEILTNRHAPPTMAKFLEYPARQNIVQIRQILIDELQGHGQPISGTLKAGSSSMPPIARSTTHLVRDLRNRILGVLRAIRGR